LGLLPVSAGRVRSKVTLRGRVHMGMAVYTPDAYKQPFCYAIKKIFLIFSNKDLRLTASRTSSASFLALLSISI